MPDGGVPLSGGGNGALSEVRGAAVLKRVCACGFDCRVTVAALTAVMTSFVSIAISRWCGVLPVRG